MAQTTAGGASMRPYLRMSNLFVRDLDTAQPRENVMAELSKFCIGGKVVVPTHDITGRIMGTAYLNFLSVEEANRVLERWRFSMTICGRPVRLMRAVDPRHRDSVFGSQGLNFQLSVRNLSEEVDEKALFERFSRYGEVYSVKVDEANACGLVHFMDEVSVSQAAAAEDGTEFCGTTITTELRGTPSTIGIGSGSGSSGVAAAAPPPPTADDFPALPGARPIAQLSSSGAATMAAVAAAAASAPAPSLQLQPAPPPPRFPAQEPQLPLVGCGSSGSSSAAAAPARIPSGSLPPHLSMLLDRQFGGANSHSGGSVAPPGSLVSGGSGSSASGAPVTPSLSAPLLRQPSSAAEIAAANAQRRSSCAGGGGSAAAGPTVAARAAAAVHGRGGGGSARGLVAALAQQLDVLSDMLCCPITQEVFRDPVVASDGQTYERAAIVTWMAKSDTSPMTNEPLAHGQLFPNKLVSAVVEELGLLI